MNPNPSQDTFGSKGFTMKQSSSQEKRLSMTLPSLQPPNDRNDSDKRQARG